MIGVDQKEALVKAAKEVLENNYATKNNSKYSAAVLTKAGNIYPAISYFSDTYSLTLHGEQSALSHAASHGEGEIIAIAIASKEIKKLGEFTNPCHMCKQLLYESIRNSNLSMLVILTNEHNETKEVMLNEMISYPWPV
jgi:cytidine deaminase